MKTFLKIILWFFGVLALLVLFYLSYGSIEKAVVNFTGAEACYSWGMATRNQKIPGFNYYNDIPHAQCVCSGFKTRACPLGSSCEGGTVYCVGKIAGYKYHADGREFSTLQEWENYCDSLENDGNRNAASCVAALERTKAAEAE